MAIEAINIVPRAALQAAPAPVPVAARLRRDILSRRAQIGVIGLGYVGMPLGVAFAESGFAVVGFEVDARRVAAINAGQSPIQDESSERVGRLVKSGFLRATVDMGQLADVDIVMICVPTPLDQDNNPNLSYVSAATEQVALALRRGQMVILESTTYPGTTRDVVLTRLEETGLRAGEDFFLAFSPERVDPGNPTYGITNTTKVTGGLDDSSTDLATLLYRQAIDTVVPVSSPEAAEMVKLLENTFRSVNIALANEMALMCDQLGIDVWEVIDAAATKPFGFMPFYPGPGVGGHCIPLDPFYLSWKMRTLNYQARFIELAGEINDEMPLHVVTKVIDSLGRCGRDIRGANVHILGVAYKPDIDDPRESPALPIIERLRQLGASVSFTDPHVPAIELRGQALATEPLTAERLEAADCVVIVTNHRAFDYELIAHHAPLIIDTRNALKGVATNGTLVVGL